MTLIALSISLLTLVLLIALILQIRAQRRVTEKLLEDSRARAQIYRDADESTTVILGRTLQNISSGHPDPNLESDSYSIKAVRELVKRELPKEKWLEIQSNQRLLHELYLLLRDVDGKKDPQRLRARLEERGPEPGGGRDSGHEDHQS